MNEAPQSYINFTTAPSRDASSQGEIDNDPRMPALPLEPGERYRFHFDMSLCIGCHCCEVACEEQNDIPHDYRWRMVGELTGGEFPFTRIFHQSMACNHCLEPACLEVCPTDAYSIDPKTGIVLHSEDMCIGCQYCTWACPYEAPKYNPTRNVVGKCHMCHHRLEDGDMPACVAACPSQAIKIETVDTSIILETIENAQAPGLPDARATVSTTRITLPEFIPESIGRVSAGHLQPQHAHHSLILMTVLTQLCVGGFVTLWGTTAFGAWENFGAEIDKWAPFVALPMFGITILAFAAATLHLGRPAFAYRALKMVKRSWLSREIALFSLFLFSGLGHTVLVLLVTRNNWSDIHLISGAIVGAIGIVALYSTVKIYMVPARPSWNSWRTPAGFLTTAILLGSLGAAALLCAGLQYMGAPTESWKHAGIFPCLIVAICAASVAILVQLSPLVNLDEHSEDELRGTALLLLGNFRTIVTARLALLILSGIVLPVWAIGNLSNGGDTNVVAILIASSLLAIIAEMLGRYLFFVTVVPKSIPRGFFSSAGAY